MSIAERQTLSLVASLGASRKVRRSFETDNSYASHALRSLCILGANGSGKSNLVNAMKFTSHFVGSSAKDYSEGDAIPVTPFKLNTQLENDPSEFEIIFVTENTLYQYGFTADPDRVWGEWLFARNNAPKSQLRTLFQREYDDLSGDYIWEINEHAVKGERELWKEATRSNALFLSTAIQLNSKSLRPIATWITRFFRTLDSPDRLMNNFSAKKVRDDKNTNSVLNFMKSADINIQNIDVEIDKENGLDFPENVKKLFKESAIERLQSIQKKQEYFNVKTEHLNELGESVYFPIEDESFGTQVLFSLAGPILDVIENGFTLVVDELHNSLHPHALRHIVELFHDPDINKNNAQLIFTTHETSTLAKDLMHRDQIWFCEKNDRSETKLFPLSDFKTRDYEFFQKRYLNGQFGAVPKIRNLEK